MSDDAQEPDGASDGNEPNIKALREAAEQGRKDRAEKEQLQRELAFAKAGIDTESKLGGMLFKTWDGDLSDVAGLKAEWSELAPAAPTPVPAIPEGFQDPAEQQQHRDKVAAGTPSGEGQPDSKNPVDLAFERFHGNLAVPLQDRQEGAISTMLEAYFQGDKRVMFDKQAFQQQAALASRDDLEVG